MLLSMLRRLLILSKQRWFILSSCTVKMNREGEREMRSKPVDFEQFWTLRAPSYTQIPLDLGRWVFFLWCGKH